jgi:REP element-mobilizing transposase RayT
MSFLQPPLAYFLTWTTYGTRLHGDPRGTVDCLHNRTGSKMLADSPGREERARLVMSQDEYIMGDEERTVVTVAIQDHCRIRVWPIHALNVRTNHVHVVVTAYSHSPDQVMEQLKGWGTRRLTTAGLIQRGRLVWTDGGSKRWLNFPEDLADAVNYVLHGQ